MKKMLIFLGFVPFLISSCPTCYGQKLVESENTVQLFSELSKSFEQIL